jgi:hypothetical protein
MFIDVVPNGRSASAVLLRESYREGSKVRKRTLANLSKLPAPVLDGLRVLLQGGTVVARPEELFEIQRSLPHGHVAAVVGMMRKLDLPRLLSRTVSRERDLALALIASRIIAPGSKLATARALSPETASSSLGGCSISASSRNVRFMPRSTGWANNKTALNDLWRVVT